MAAYPDTTSEWTGTPGGKLKDTAGVAYAVGDKAGYLMYTHDRTGGGNQTSLLNYVSLKTTKYYYTADSDGTIHQYDKAGGTEFTD
ncbi:MAG: hypothetical protein HY673_25465 [Chloroflexi bacterium]|nr:hypothetical protein [Chloroflexota bacterium]